MCAPSCCTDYGFTPCKHVCNLSLYANTHSLMKYINLQDLDNMTLEQLNALIAAEEAACKAEGGNGEFQSAQPGVFESAYACCARIHNLSVDS